MADPIAVVGAKELQRRLYNLGTKGQKAALRKATRKGARVILAAAKKEIPVKTGSLRRSLKTVARTRKGVVSTTVRAGGTGARHANLVEYGTKDRRHKSGKYVGKMPKLEPMKKAVNAKGGQAIDVAAAELLTQITAEATRGSN
jgi:HK97 gp10 family phage protein